MALGPKPWTWLNRRLGVNKPGTDWFNAVTTALWTLDIMFSDATDEASIHRPNADGSFWKIVLPRSWANFKGVDDLSLDDNGGGDDGKMQIFGWDSAVDGGSLQSGSLIPVQLGTGARTLVYANARTIQAWLDDEHGGTPRYSTWSELTDTVGDPTQAAKLGYIPVVTRYGAGPYSYALELTDMSATGVGPFWVKGAAAADCYGEEIGNDSAVKVIDLDAETMNTAGGHDTLDWGACQLLESAGGTMTADWLARQLDGADWTVLAGTIFKVADTTHADEEDGAMKVSGGGYFALGVYAKTNSDYNKAGAFVGVNGHECYLGQAAWAGHFQNGSGAKDVDLGGNTYAVNASSDGGINSVAGYFDNGTAGADGWFDDGENFRVTVSGGLVTAIAASSGGGYG